jgi:hypothetical protein
MATSFAHILGKAERKITDEEVEKCGLMRTDVYRSKQFTKCCGEALPDAALQWARELIHSASWRFAKSMPRNPHEYITLVAAGSSNLRKFAYIIRKYGYWSSFHGVVYIKLDIDGYSYWQCGEPTEETVLINRAKRKNPEMEQLNPES